MEEGFGGVAGEEKKVDAGFGIEVSDGYEVGVVLDYS